jgi:two-component system chemotaxis response regulator CheY
MSDKEICLIVDDSEVIREISARIVADLGFRAAQAENAGEAVAFCTDNAARVVLLDWDLPSMGALDFLRGAAELPEAERPVVILCATENDHQQFTLAKAAGAAHHILKPYDRAAVEAVFAEAGIIEAGTAKVAEIGKS